MFCRDEGVHRGRLDDSRGSNDQKRVASLHSGISFLKNVLVERFAEPDDMRAQKALAGFALGQNRQFDREVAGNLAAFRTANLPDASVKFNDFLAARLLMKTVNVLGQDRHGSCHFRMESISIPISMTVGGAWLLLCGENHPEFQSR